MKVGLLLCDHVAVPLQDASNGDYDNIYSSMLNKAARNLNLERGMTIESYFVVDECFPESTDECDAWLVTCSHHDSYSREPWIIRLKQFVMDVYCAGKPLVGICFGHQLIAMTLGGKVARRKQWIAGVQSIQLKSNPVSSKINIKLLGIHRDEVVLAPENASVIGSTPNVPISVILISPNVLTFQYHIEYTKKYFNALIKSRQGILGTDITQSALNELEQELDSESIAIDVLKFLKDKCNQKK